MDYERKLKDKYEAFHDYAEMVRADVEGHRSENKEARTNVHNLTSMSGASRWIRKRPR